MTTLEPTTPPSSSLVAAPSVAAPSVSVATQGAAPVATLPPVIVSPGAPGSSTTTVVYVNPPATAGGATGVDASLPRPSRKSASLLTAYALFFFFGWTGMHQVYLGNTRRGVSYIFTFSWFTIALWIDLFTLPSQVRRVNTERLLGLR